MRTNARKLPGIAVGASARRAGVIGVAAAGLICVPLALGSASAADWTTVAMWNMDETSGTTMTDAASAGGLSNGTTHSVKLGVAGRTGKGYELNGKSSYVSVPPSGSLNPGMGDLKVAISFKTTKLPSSADWDLIRKGYYSTSGGEFKVELQPSGRASCGFKGARYAYLEAGPSNLANGAWHTLTCTKTARSISLTIDSKTFTKSVKVGAISNREPVIIGAYPGKEFFPGTLDDASIAIG